MSANSPIDEREWIEIPAGEFLMSSPEDEPEHEEDEIEHSVEVKAFSSMRHTVTFNQYDEYCALKGCVPLIVGAATLKLALTHLDLG